MSTEIFLPIFYMLILTSAVFLFNTIIRFKDVLIDKGHRGSELYGLSLPSSASNITKQGDRNFYKWILRSITHKSFILCSQLGNSSVDVV